MKLYHKTPCADCPWRKTSDAGWLGGYEPEQYADPVQMNEIPACHNRDFSPDDPRSAMCVGALATAKNQCIQPHKTAGAVEAAAIIGKRDDCFKNVSEFYKHHADKDYVHPLYRMLDITPPKTTKKKKR